MNAWEQAGYVGDRAQRIHDLDHRLCRCGHRSLSHGSGAGYGDGACGFCECTALVTSPLISGPKED